MKAKSGLSRFDLCCSALGLAASLASIAIYGLWPDKPPKASWVQTCGDIEFRIENGKTVRTVNPFSYPASVFVSDASGVTQYFEKIPSGMVSNALPCYEGWTCTVWAPGPIAFTKIRRPE